MRDKESQQVESQQKVLDIFNKVMQWNEKSATDAVEKFVSILGLPDLLKAAGVEVEDELQKTAEMTMTDVWVTKRSRLKPRRRFERYWS